MDVHITAQLAKNRFQCPGPSRACHRVVFHGSYMHFLFCRKSICSISQSYWLPPIEPMGLNHLSHQLLTNMFSRIISSYFGYEKVFPSPKTKLPPIYNRFVLFHNLSNLLLWNQGLNNLSGKLPDRHIFPRNPKEPVDTLATKKCPPPTGPKQKKLPPIYNLLQDC